MARAKPKMEDLTAVISRDFCVPRHVHLTVVRKLLAVTDGNFEVTDEDGNIMFKVKRKLFSLHDRCILLDAGGTPIATLRKKVHSLINFFLDSVLVFLFDYDPILLYFSIWVRVTGGRFSRERAQNLLIFSSVQENLHSLDSRLS